ncbi:ECF-type sigma factor [Rheinheimera sp. UJ63]|uniref:ECF-type sigma factor n=1 Tax=Rheinheimera sp. UJ63 TaxID=2910157 RepID=UPI003FA7AB5F
MRALTCDRRTLTFFKTFAQVIYTILIDHTRKQRALKRDFIQVEETTKDEQLLLDKLIDMQSHLEDLKGSFDRQVAVFLLKYACKVPNAEIAEMMSISLSSVEKDLLFVKQHLALTFA